MAAKKRRPAKAHKPARKHTKPAKRAKKTSKVRKPAKRAPKRASSAHRPMGHGESLHKGPNWVTAREVGGRMHVTNSLGESGTVSVAEWREREEHLIRDGWKHGRHASKHSSAHHSPAHHSPAPHSTVPSSEWDRLWHAYIEANKSGSLTDQIRAGRALLKFDKVHGTPPLPHVATKLREAKELLIKHGEAFEEARALELELKKAERAVHKHGHRKHPKPRGLAKTRRFRMPRL